MARQGRLSDTPRPFKYKRSLGIVGAAKFDVQQSHE